MDEKEDDLDIDLGKMWPFGKKKEGQPGKEEHHKEEKAEQHEQRPEHEHHKKHEAAHEDAEDEVSIGETFGKLKGLFKQGPKAHREKAPQDEDELSLDTQAISGFFHKNSRQLLIVAAIIIIAAAAAYVRMLPGQMLYAEDWAKQSTYGFLRADIEQSILAQYPNLPDRQKNELIDKDFNEALKKGEYAFRTGQYAGQSANIKQQVQQTAEYFKTFYLDDQGNAYMPDIDPYYWFRYARNIVDHGYPGDTIKNGRSYDTFQLAPEGRYVEPEDTFHPYSIALFYRILRIFNPGMTLMYAEMLYPVIIAALAAVIVFFICRRIAGDVGGLFAGLLMALNPSALSRSLFGHGDSDTWVLFFSVLTAFLFLMAIESKSLKWQTALTFLAGLSMGLFSRIWGGWWFIYNFLLAASAVYFGYIILANRKQIAKGIGNLFTHEVKTALTVTLMFILFSGIFVSLLSGLDTFILSPIGSLAFTRIKAPVMESLFPNVLTTVAELNEGGINDIMNNVGGPVFFFTALLGIMISMTKKRVDWQEWMFILGSAAYWLILLLMRGELVQEWFLILLSLPILARTLYAGIMHEPIDMRVAALLIIWFIVTMYASTKGIRFVMLLVPAFAIAFGVAIGFIHKRLEHSLTTDLKIQRTIASVTVFALLLVLVMVPSNAWAVSISIAKQDVPIINDAWYNSLAAIRDNSNRTAIITSWWDFGHHFKALAERPVTFDGTTQGSPQAHWVGQILKTDDEEMAVGILRMLDCGGNNAFEEVQKANGNDTLMSIGILYSVFKDDREAAGKKLRQKYGMTAGQAEAVLKYTHCEPPEAFFIASEDMIGKSGVWAHFGSWDFEKAYIWNRLREKPAEEAIAEMQSKLNYTSEQAEQTYYDIQAMNDAQGNTWISPWPSYGQILNCDGKTGICDTIGLDAGGGRRLNIVPAINFSANDAVLLLEGQEPKNLRAVAIATEKGVEQKSHSENVGIDWAATIIPEGDNYRMVMAAPELNASMFTRMFFMKGHSLRHFKLLTYQRSITGAEIYVYRVDWKGGEMHTKSELTTKESVGPQDSVTFNYIGYLEDGTVFDSSIYNWDSRNITKDQPFGEDSAPFTFTMGKSEIIPGLEEQMTGMKAGEEKTARISPEKAYGTEPDKHPLGNKTLFFRFRIEKIR